MAPTEDSRVRPLSRRRALASVAGLSLTAGCVDRLRAVDSRTGAPQIGFEIKTLPTDEDPFAMRVARQLAEWFQTAGIDATVLPVTGDELLSQVLLQNDYDAFVAQFPGRMHDPDELYGLAHSSYAAEPGWQNPFGYSSLSTDETLERQRSTSGAPRREAVDELQEQLLEQNPFTVLTAPERIAAVRRDRFDGLDGTDLRDWRAYFSIQPIDPDLERLRLATTDSRAMSNLNPLSPEYRRDGLLTGLLYDPLVRVDGDDTLPWLARSVTWPRADRPSARIELDPEATWHDGRAITAADVAFTYEFLRDTALDDHEEAVPATRYRGRSSLVTDVTVRDDHTAVLDFVDSSQAVASRALTVPLLPEHVWGDRAEPVARQGSGTTRALVTDNVPPIGSGPLQFERVHERRQLVLSRFEEHHTRRSVADDLPAPYREGLAFADLAITFVASDAAAVELLAADDADATIANLGPNVVPRIGREGTVDLTVTPGGAVYYAGYNTRRPPFSNSRFRALLARLIDRSALVDRIFEGYGHPAMSPLAGTGWVPASLGRGEDGSAASFLGKNGTVDTEAARDAFAAAGYRYDERDRLRGS